MTRRSPVPVTCPDGRHRHGTLTMYRQHLCGCQPCKDANRRTVTRHRIRANRDQLQPLVPGVGTRRRLRALVARGWSAIHLGAELGVHGTHVWRLLTNTGDVSVDTDRRVRRVYDRLWNVEPPQTTAAQRAAATKSRRWAERCGWPPPLAWDDDTIDMPTARPNRGYDKTATTAFDQVAVERAVAGDRVRLTLAERREAHRLLLERGLSVAEAAEVLGVETRTALRQRSAARRATAA